MFYGFASRWTILTLLVGCGGSPRLATDYPPPRPHETVDWLESGAPPMMALDGRAAPEKEREADRGPCEYPGPFVPCWCGTFGLPSSCDPAEYAESVQIYGPPRFYVPIRGASE